MLYVIRNLGVGRSLLYMILYPFRFLRGIVKKLDDLHDEIRWHKKISGYVKIAGLHQRTEQSSQINSETKEYFKQFGFDINTDWNNFYEHLSGIKSKYYIPDDIFFREVEPALNSRSLSSFYSDKNNYGKFLENFNQPKTILRFISGNYYNSNYKLLSSEEAQVLLFNTSASWIIKPSVGSGGGKGVNIGSSKNDRVVLNGQSYTFSQLQSLYKRGYIIQHIIEQHEELARFHKASLNTFRVITLRLNNRINYLSCVIKFGVNNNLIDNSKSGGVWCGVNKDGHMKPYCLTQNFEKRSKHPTTKLSFENIHFDFYHHIIDFVKLMHHQLLHLDIVSWDIGFDKNSKPVLIEFNPKFQGIYGCQAINGPLFGDLTDEVLAEVIKRRDRRRS